MSHLPIQGVELHYVSVTTLTEDDLIEEAVKKLLSYDINRIPVVRDANPIAIVSQHDLLKLMICGRGTDQLHLCSTAQEWVEKIKIKAVF